MEGVLRLCILGHDVVFMALGKWNLYGMGMIWGDGWSAGCVD